jgi:hypothetical protein
MSNSERDLEGGEEQDLIYAESQVESRVTQSWLEWLEQSGSEEDYEEDEDRGVDTEDEEERWHIYLQTHVFVYPVDHLLYSYQYGSYVNRIEVAYRNFVSQYADGPQVVVPQYPDEDARSISSMDELDYLLNDRGQSMVYRYSHRYNQRLGWIMIQPIHLYSADKFHAHCGIQACTLCAELTDRFINFRSGHYDYLRSQLDGRYDSMPFEANPMEFALALPPGEDPDNDMPELLIQPGWANDDLTAWDQQMQDIQPMLSRPHVIMFHEGHCVICYDTICEDQLTSVLPCGHYYHVRCLGEWDTVTSTCPLCREPYDMLGAEGLSTTIQVEYTAVNELGSVEYDDPVAYYDLEHRDGKYQLYIFTGELEYGQRLRIDGTMLQVKDLKLDFSLHYNVGTFTYGSVGSFELEIIATSQVTAMLVSDDAGGEPVIDPTPYIASTDEKCTRTILLTTIGTYGDVRPFQLLVKEYRALGYECKLLAPTHTGADFEFDYAAIEHLYRASPRTLPSIETLKQLPAVRCMAQVMRIAIEQTKPDLIISSPVMPGIRYMAAQYQIPYVTVSAIPHGEGALTYMEQSTPWSKWFAQVFESITLSMTELVAVFDDFFTSSGTLRFPASDPVHRFFTIAPELYAEGCGNMILNQPSAEPVRYDYDVYFGLGSMIQAGVEDRYISMLRGMKYRVLFQTSRRTGVDKNITFIGHCNHEDVFRQVPVVMCHGGSGTLQTALRYGCRVLVHPCWVDQKYWPLTATQSGFDVEFLDSSTVLASRQVSQKCQLGRAQYRLSGVLPRDLAIRIIGSVHKQETPVGSFIFSSDIPMLRSLSQAERLFTGSTRCEHAGIGHRSKDGLVRYAELWYDGSTVRAVECVSQEISSCITAVKFLDMPYDPNVLASFVPAGYTLLTNCRTAVDKYLEHYHVGYTLDKWNEEKKGQIATRFLGSRKVEISAVIPGIRCNDDSEPQFMSIPHTVYHTKADGNCLYHCIERAMNVTVAEQKQQILDKFNEYCEELDRPPTDTIPYYTDDLGDLVPLAIATTYDLRLAIYVNSKYVTIVNDSGMRTLYLLLTQDDEAGTAHYDLIEHQVSNDVGGVVNADAKGYVQGKIQDSKLSPLLGVMSPIHKKKLRAIVDQFVIDHKLETPVQFGAGIRDYVARCGDKVLKVTAETINTLYTSVHQVKVEDSIYNIYIIPYWYDDGLPIYNRTIRWPQGLLGSKNFCTSDDHRGNYRSLGGFAVPIDQFIGAEESPTKGSPTKLLYK